jgi:hypothetical protein
LGQDRGAVSVERATPRGPTATELRRRALAHEAGIVASDPVPDYPENAPCSFHGR